MASHQQIVIHINANVPWRWKRASSNYVAVCDPLKITLQAKTYGELMEDINEALNALILDLLETNEWDAFLREQGWQVIGPIPTQLQNVQFDVPFSILPFAGVNNDSGTSRRVHQ